MEKVKSASVDARLLCLAEAAERLGVSIWTLRAWVQTGKISSHKLGRRRLVSSEEVARLIDSSHIPASAGISEKMAVA